MNRSIALGALALFFASCGSPPRPPPPLGTPERAESTRPRFSTTGPNAEDYGESRGYPFGAPSTAFDVRFRVGAFSHLDELFVGRTIARAPAPSTLTRAPVEPTLRYEYKGESLTLDDYLAKNATTGILILRDETILVERYQYDRNDRHRFTSWSMAKTVTSMLVGIAIAEGRIRSVDDLAEAYVPELAGTEYGKTPLKHLLQMSSGVRFSEDYSGSDDVSKLSAATIRQVGEGGVAAVSAYNERLAPSGTKFVYASVESQVLGLALRRAIGRPIVEYLHEKIWSPIGAEADATWIVDRSGQEATYCCINAVLRDYARFALLLANDGNWRGRPIIPASFLHDATTVRADQPHLKNVGAKRFFGYGYQTWIFPGERRMFALLGVFGQAIFVDPQLKLVMVHAAARKNATDPSGGEAIALWQGIVGSMSRGR